MTVYSMGPYHRAVIKLALGYCMYRLYSSSVCDLLYSSMPSCTLYPYLFSSHLSNLSQVGRHCHIVMSFWYNVAARMNLVLFFSFWILITTRESYNSTNLLQVRRSYNKMLILQWCYLWSTLHAPEPGGYAEYYHLI